MAWPTVLPGESVTAGLMVQDLTLHDQLEFFSPALDFTSCKTWFIKKRGSCGGLPVLNGSLFYPWNSLICPWNLVSKWILHASLSSGTRCGWGEKRAGPLAVAVNSAEEAEADRQAGLGLEAAIRKAEATHAPCWASSLVLSTCPPVFLPLWCLDSCYRSCKADRFSSLCALHKEKGLII